MKNIVFLVGSYYPNYSAVGRCQGNLADEFEKRGYNVTVIAQSTVSNEAKEEYLEKQHIIRVKTKDLEGDRICREQLKKGKKEYWLKHKLYQLKRVFKIVFSKNSLDKALVKAYSNALEGLDINPDLIIPTCQPFETVAAAMEYIKLNSNCNIIPVLYDLFAESRTLHRFGWNRSIKMKANLLLEKNMVDFCTSILHMPGWNRCFEKYDTKKIIKIEHPLIVNPKLTSKALKCTENNKRGIDLLFAGSLIENYVDPDYLLEFVKKCEKINKIDFYSSGSAYGKVLSCVSEKVKGLGWISHGDLLEKMQEADVLVNIAEVSGKQISSKIFEYMSMGKAILHIYHSDSDINLEYLRKYPKAYCIKADLETMEKEIEGFSKWCMKTSFLALGFDAVSEIFIEMTPKYICDILVKAGGV